MVSRRHDVVEDVACSLTMYSHFILERMEEVVEGDGRRHVAVDVLLVVPLVLVVLAAAALLLHGSRRARAAMRRLAPVALLHVNLVLALYAGAGLATAARLKWDPSTYIAVRELFPAEYRVATVVLAVASFVLLLLLHLAAVPLCLTGAGGGTARTLYLLYAAGMCSLLALEVGWGVWTGRSIAAWLHSEQAAQMMELAELRDHIQPILQILAKYHPLPDKISALIEEAEADAPRNMYVALSVALLLAVVQPAAVVLALLAAQGAGGAATSQRDLAPPSPPPDFDAPDDGWSYSRSESESAPLKARFKNGKLVMV